MTPVLQSVGLTKTYAQGEAAMRALDDVTLDLYAGDLALLVGPSGSGKTTLLSIMGCILAPDERLAARARRRGDAACRTRAAGDSPRAYRLRVPGVQSVSHSDGTAERRPGARLKGVSGRQARDKAAALLNQVGLAAKLDAYPADLSGGQKQRIAIARALAGDPPILLADEPTAALDSHSGRTVMDLLQRLARERGRAVVIVTHDSRMLGYGDRIVTMEDGRVVADERQSALEGAVA